MEKLKLKSVKITFKDGSSVTYEDLVNIDQITVRANCSETSIIVRLTYNNFQNEVRHDEDIVYKSKDIKEIVQRWL